MNRLTYFLCVSLSITSISFFSVGFAEFTLFHALLAVFLGYLMIRGFQGKALNAKIPIALIALALYISISNLLISSTFKVTSYLYSLIIIIELIILAKVSRKLEEEDVRKIVKGIILLFFISIAVESLLILLHITPTGVWAQIFPIYDYAHQIRPMGLSNEPSYAAITLVFALYVLIRCDNFTFNVKEGAWYLLAVIAIFLSGSTYGYALLSLLLVYFALKGRFFSIILKYLLKNPAIGMLVLLALVSVLVLFLVNLDNKSFQRLVKIYTILNEAGLNISALLNIAYVDSSAGMRIVPSLQLIDYFSSTNLVHVLFGKGAGQATYFYSSLWGQLTQVGFIPAFIYNYGVIGFLVCLFCIKTFFPKKGVLLTILYFLFLFNADFNTQIFVYVLFTVMMSAQLEKLDLHESQVDVNSEKSLAGRI